MSKWRVLLVGAISGLLVLAHFYAPRPAIREAEAQGVGIFSRQLCTSLTSPQAGQTFCLEGTTNSLKVWDGTTWQLASFATSTQTVALGGAPNTRFLVDLSGTYTVPANAGAALRIDPTLTAAANQNLYMVDVGGTLTSVAGTHPVFAALNLGASNNFSVGTITNSTQLYIPGPLTGGSSSYAALVDSGVVFLRTGAALRTDPGNNAFGTAPDTRALLIMGGTTVGTSEAYTLLVAGDASPTVNNSAMQVRLSGTIHRASSGTHPLATTLTVEEPGFAAGSAAVTDTATVLIRSVSPVGGSNYPLWIATSSQSPAGVAIRAEGFASFTQSTSVPGGPAIGNSGAGLMLVAGSGNGVVINNQNNTVQLMQMENAGGLTIGSPTLGGRGVGTINYASASFANGRGVIVASAANPNLQNIGGISRTGTAANNLRGTCTFAAASTCVQQFAANEPDASYFVAISCAGTNPVGLSGKGVSGFTLTATASNSNACDWILVR